MNNLEIAVRQQFIAGRPKRVKLGYWASLLVAPAIKLQRW